MTAIPHTIAQNGDVLTARDLPPVNVLRWTPTRKANVVHAVNGGLITVAEACERYDISRDEYYGWSEAIYSAGVDGLKLREIERVRRAN